VNILGKNLFKGLNKVMYKRFILFFSIMIILSLSCAEKSQNFIKSNTFDFTKGEWKEIYLKGNSGGSFDFNKNNLELKLTNDGFYGLYNTTPFAGHILTEAQFSSDDNINLLLFFDKNGRPDLDNFTGIQVETNKDGISVVRVIDRQNGRNNVLDNTGQLLKVIASGKKRFNNDDYEHVLTGKEYSVPFTGTSGKLRIFFDSAAGFFHYYYSVKKVIHGKEAEGWMELAPSRTWGSTDQKYYLALLANKKGKAIFNGVSVERKPIADQDDRKTGFKAARREYNWSGFFGDAVVVSFDDNFKFHNKDIKFVFWSEMNYIPAWHINNQLLFTYEFVETWGGGNLGCHEPMSDRLLRWSNVKILEDNPVRKVIRWHYVLCNPQYKVPMDNEGTQLPEVDEYWTFYPDGSGTRYIRYFPKLDTEFRESHELAELIGIAGSSSNTIDHFDSPALTLFNLEGRKIVTHPGPKFDFDSEINNWKQQIFVVHFKNEPDFYGVFSADPRFPDTYSGYKLEYQNTWHNTDQILIHWPVQKRPYTGPNGSTGLWKAEVAHACLVSIDIHDGIEWTDNFKIDERGRKYRDWVMLVGAAEKNSDNDIRVRTISWLNPGKITNISKGAEFEKVDRRGKSLIFIAQADIPVLSFKFTPNKAGSGLINPVIHVIGWGKVFPEAIYVDNNKQNFNNYKSTILNNKDLLLWLKIEIDKESEIRIER